MVNVNKTQFKRGLRRKAWRYFWKMARRSSSEDELVKNLATLLTDSEMAVLEKRLAIPFLLAEGFSYREIGRAIDASPTAISFVKHHLTRKPRTPRRYDPLYPPREKKHITFPPITGPGRWRWLDELGR